MKGLLALFTGKGCETARDVNFFRPVYVSFVRFRIALNIHRNGGNTEVDVNDVSALLEPVIAQRKAEKTWDVDEFRRIAALAREPDKVKSHYFVLKY